MMNSILILSGKEYLHIVKYILYLLNICTKYLIINLFYVSINVSMHVYIYL